MDEVEKEIIGVEPDGLHFKKSDGSQWIYKMTTTEQIGYSYSLLEMKHRATAGQKSLGVAVFGEKQGAQRKLLVLKEIRL